MHTKNKVLTISVLGLGKLGACYAAFAARHGIFIVGTDADMNKVAAINKGLAPVVETNLQAYIDKYKNRLRATHSTREAVLASTATFIIVPTPSKKDGSFSPLPAISACTEIGKALKEKRGYHLVVLVSTLLPEDCRTHIIPALENASGKHCGIDFGFCYSPSLIAIGDVLNNLEHPDFIFLGAFDKKSETTLSRIYKVLYPSLQPECMSIESAELAKIALNSFITTKITFANTLAMLCEKIPHTNVDHITTALGKDKRVGSRCIKSGLGFGGPCLPRDNAAFAQMANRRGVHTPIALATHIFNKDIPKRMALILHVLAKKYKAKRIGFLGVSYKTCTTLIEDSQALSIADAMARLGYTLAIFEPLGSHEAFAHFEKKALYPVSLKDIVEWVDILFISNRDENFRNVPSLMRKSSAKKIIVDPWGMFQASDFNTAVVYIPLGRSPK